MSDSLELQKYVSAYKHILDAHKHWPGTELTIRSSKTTGSTKQI